MLAVAKSLLWMVMNLNHQTVSAPSDGGQAERRNQAGFSRRMGRVDNYGQMGELFYRRDGCYVQGVPGVAFECPDASLAKDNIRVA